MLIDINNILRKDKRLGLRIAAVSFVLTSIAAIGVFSGFKRIAFPYVIVGFVGGFVGMIIHYREMYKNFKKPNND